MQAVESIACERGVSKAWHLLDRSDWMPTPSLMQNADLAIIKALVIVMDHAKGQPTAKI